ncbi:tumor necrosis factor receptor superfamily member 4 [Sphaeramia orbicularis]|uniref:tumor necrosis factor receptor superfamily member 4 n=1 Tax=Sphaeramia orbicularis TaxID=375764 RepID=UPI00118156E2|nr:tumor necrosis factor receptor superfamily member 4-like [Sphaeramia orbicularis]
MFSLTLRGSQVTSRLTLSSMMWPNFYITLVLLCSYCLLCSVLSQPCDNKTQYLWPMDNPTLCCNMCPPGHYMYKRNPNTCHIDCKPCADGRYSDTHTFQMRCDSCIDCNKPNLNMEYETPCSSTQNAVCRCKAGYTYKDISRTSCTPITSQQPTSSTTETVEYKPSCNNTHNAACRCKAGDCPPVATTNRPILRPSTSAIQPQTTSTKPAKPIKDTVWFLVIVFLLCAGIIMIIATKISPVLHWIRSKHGYCLANKPIPVAVQVPLCTEEDEVSKPVQEMCGKCDQPIDV